MTVAPPRRRSSAVVAAAPRLAARARAERAARRVRWAKRTGLLLLASVPLLVLAWVLLVSSWLAVDRVEIRGTGRLSVDEVLAAVALEPGTPLARVDTGAVADAVRRLPPVADVQVRRSWPGALEVTVTERVVAAGVAHGAAVTLVDRSGVPFASAPSLPKGVVRLQTDSPGPDDPATRAALQVHRDLPAALRTRVATVQAPSPSSVVLVLRDGKQVEWGAPGRTETKAAAALALLPKPGKVVDVSAPGVAVRR